MNSNEIIKVLDEVTTRISGPAEKVWEIYVRQSYIDGATGILGVLVFGILTYLCYRGLRQGVSGFDKCESFESEQVTAGQIVLCGMGVVVFSLLMLSVGERAITALANPEYHALKQLMSSLK